MLPGALGGGAAVISAAVAPASSHQKDIPEPRDGARDEPDQTGEQDGTKRESTLRSSSKEPDASGTVAGSWASLRPRRGSVAGRRSE